MKLLNNIKKALGKHLIAGAPFGWLSKDSAIYYKVLYKLNDDDELFRTRMQTILVTHILRERLMVDPVALIKMYMEEFGDELTVEESHMMFFYVSKGVQELISNFDGFIELAGKLPLPDDVKPIYDMYKSTYKSVKSVLPDEESEEYLNKLDEDLFIDPDDYHDNQESDEDGMQMSGDEDIIQALHRKADRDAKEKNRFHRVLSKMSKDELNDVINDIIDLMSKNNK
jgi:hypothetical protein